MSRVLLVSGIYFPDVGGPATHVRRIAEHFSSLGWTVTVVTFGDLAIPAPSPFRVVRISRRYPKIISWFLYALTIVRESLRHDVLYAFDLTTAGIPTATAARILRRPFLLRIGGDPIWERGAERGEHFIPLLAYYERGLYKKHRVKIPLLLFVVRSAERIIVYNQMFKDFYVRYFKAPAERISIIRNPFPSAQVAPAEEGSFTCVFAGRFVLYKNLRLVLRAAAVVHKTHPDFRLVFIGTGPEEETLRHEARALNAPLEIHPTMAQKGLFEFMKGASLAIAPALTEFNPNFILEALALGKPILISREHGLSVPLPAFFEFDPMSEVSLTVALTNLLDPEKYKEAQLIVAGLPMDQSWEKVLAAQESIVRKALSSHV